MHTKFSDFSELVNCWNELSINFAGLACTKFSENLNSLKSLNSVTLRYITQLSHTIMT